MQVRGARYAFPVPRRSLLLLALLGLTLSPALGCGPRATGQKVADGADPGEASEFLKGSWVLQEFRPEDAFEPMLRSLVEAQFGTLVVTFDGTTLTAQGPGIATTRSYEVVQSLFGRVDIVIFGDDGTTYEMVGQFIGDDLQFESRTQPWRGKGRLGRP